MEFFGRGRGGCRAKQEQALGNPIRARILELFVEDDARALTPTALVAELATTDNRFTKVSVSQVAYHLACLRDAQLIPADRVDPG